MASLGAVGQAGEAIGHSSELSLKLYIVFNCDFEALKSDQKSNVLASTMAQVFSMPNQEHVLILMKYLFPAPNFIVRSF